MPNEKVARLATDNMAQNARSAAEATGAATEAMRNTAKGGMERAQATMQAGAQQAQSVMQANANSARQAMEAGKAQAQKAGEGMFKAAEEAAEFSRGNFEALTRAAQAYAAGTQDLSRQAFALMQSLGEHTLEGARAVAGSKSVKEAAEIQANYLRQAMERLMGESARLQEASFRLVEQSSAPLTERMQVAMERAGKPLNG